MRAPGTRVLVGLAATVAAGTAGATLALALRRLPPAAAMAVVLGGPGASATGGPSVADAPPSVAPAVWPTPQQATARSDGFAISATMALVTGPSTDGPAVEVVKSALGSAGVGRFLSAANDEEVPAGTAVVWIGGPAENPASARALDALGIPGPAGLAAEGYVLGIGRSTDHRAQVVLAGVDPAGTFYAAQTLRQLVVSSLGRHWLPGVSIRDWPATPLRGVVEGFYGPPWSTEDRMSQLDFLASTKQNVYAYSPKDDSYLRAQWRQPYPADQLAVLRQLADRARRDHVRFTYALSPGLSACYSSAADTQVLSDKLQFLWDVGVRSFAIPFDDVNLGRWNCGQDAAAFGTGSGAAGLAQAALLNHVQRDFIDTHAGAARLAMVPTEFSGVADSPYKSALRQRLDPRIIVEWTGMGVVPATIRADQAVAAKQVFGHDILVWDNYPVNDYARNRLFLGPYIGREPAITDTVVGVTLNPMIESQPSGIAEFTAADFLWNPASYHAHDVWEAALHQLGGPAWAALQVFAENQSSSILNPAESATLTTLVQTFWTAYASGTGLASAAEPLSDYFLEMAAAPAQLRAGMDDPAFLAEAQPWLDKLGLYGQAGQTAVDMLVAQRAGDGMSATRDRQALTSLRTHLSAMPQAVAPGIMDRFIAQALSA